MSCQAAKCATGLEGWIITSSLAQTQQGLDQLQFVDVAQHRVALPAGGGAPQLESGGGESSPGEGDNLKYQISELLLAVIQSISLSGEERGLLLSDLTSLLSSVK